MVRVEKRGAFFKVDEAAQIAYGWAIVCTEGGKPYVDLQGDHIPDSVMLDAAIDFAANSRVGKDMHAGASVGEHLFVYPITKDAAAGLGLATVKTGLLVGFKPNDPAMLDMIKSGERTGFSIGGVLSEYDDEEEQKNMTGKPGQLRATLAKATGIVANKVRTFRAFKIHEISLVDMPAMEGAKVGYVKNTAGKSAIVLARRFSKQVVLTDSVDGHQHAIDLDDPVDWCGDRLSTTYATSEGADNAHSHVWLFDTSTGAVTIGDDSGHSHTVNAVVPPAVLASFVLNEQAEAKDNAMAALAQVLDGGSGNADVSISIAARAPATKSTPGKAAPQGGATSKEPLKMNLAKMLAVILAMSADQQAYVGKLAPDEVEPFFAKSATERDAILKSASVADAVIWTGEVTKTEVRKSDGALALTLAKQNEANAATIAKQTLEIEKARLRTEQVELEKRAGETLTHFGKSIGARAAILRAIEGIADETLRTEAIEALKGANAAMKELGLAKGANDGTDAENTESPLAKFNKGLAEFAKAKSKAPQLVTNEYLQTPEGAQLYSEYQAVNFQIRA